MPEPGGKSLVPRWMASGSLAVVFLSVAFVSFYFSFAHVLLDLAGTRAAGRVVEVRASSVWQRYRMNVPVFTVRYRFDTAAGEGVTGEHSVTEGVWKAAREGSAVIVEYLDILPALSRIERPERGVLFFIFAALTLICLWLAGMSIYRGFVRRRG